MIHWAQRQPWYIEKPMPFVMILAWPFLWLWGTVWELRRPKVQPPAVSRWGSEYRFLGSLADDLPTLEWDLPDDPDWFENYDRFVRSLELSGYRHAGYHYGNPVYSLPHDYYQREHG